MGGGGPGSNGELFYIGEIENWAFLNSKNFKNFKNQWKIYNIVQILKEILRFFENFS